MRPSFGKWGPANWSRFIFWWGRRATILTACRTSLSTRCWKKTSAISIFLPSSGWKLTSTRWLMLPKDFRWERSDWWLWWKKRRGWKIWSAWSFIWRAFSPQPCLSFATKTAKSTSAWRWPRWLRSRGCFMSHPNWTSVSSSLSLNRMRSANALASKNRPSWCWQSMWGTI